MGLRPINDNENTLATRQARTEPRVLTSGIRCRHAVIFKGVPMGLRPTHGDENLQFHTAANRAATATSGNDLANFKRFFNRVVVPIAIGYL
jgi:hypothetical protein